MLKLIRYIYYTKSTIPNMHKVLPINYLLLSSIIIISLLSAAIAKASNTTILPDSEVFFTPDTNFFNENGEKVYLDQYEGKTVLLAFWATWCGACINEMPSLDILQKDFKHLPFEIIAVSEDFNGPDVIKDHFLSQEIRHLAIYHDYQNQLFRAMSVVGLPTAFLIDKAGKVKVIFKGSVKWHDEDIRNILLAEIEGNPSTPKNSYKSSSLNKIVSLKKPLEKQSTLQFDNIKNEKKEEVTSENNKTKE